MGIKEVEFTEELAKKTRARGYLRCYASEMLDEFIDKSWYACEIEIPEGYKSEQLQVAMQREIDSRCLDNVIARQTKGKAYLVKR